MGWTQLCQAQRHEAEGRSREPATRGLRPAGASHERRAGGKARDAVGEGWNPGAVNTCRGRVVG